MSFTNLTPDISPSGVPLPLTSGLRYFYFVFVAPSSSIDIYLSRNIYRNEEFITKLYIGSSATSLLTQTYVRNVAPPTTFYNGFIGLSTPAGATYINNTNIPNFRLVNLTSGTAYYLESRTIYNDPGVDFGISIKIGSSSIPLTYLRTEIRSIPFPPTPPPPPTPTPNGAPPTPTSLSAISGTYGVILTWAESATASFYNVYRFNRFIGRVANLKFIDSHVVSGGSFSYSVSALNENGESAQSSSVTINPIFLFTSLVPDRTYDGISLVGVGIRYFYFLFVPLTEIVDVYLHFNGILNQSALIGLYNSSDNTINLLNLDTSVTNLDMNLIQGNFTLGNSPGPQVTVYGIRFATTGQYINNTSIPNFKLKNLTSLNTYILEIASVSNLTDDVYADLAMYMKNGGSDGIFKGYLVQINYNTTTIERTFINPYIISYNFSSTSAQNYSTFIYPNLFSFQNAKNVLENIISASPQARALGRTNDMLVKFNVEELSPGVLGQSSLTKWKEDASRSPDFPYEQEITFSSRYFSNGYFTSNSLFNGSPTLNGVENNALFNTLIHEILHGIGIYYISYFNTPTYNVGWYPFLTTGSNSNINDPWYKGPLSGSSMALNSYKAYCRNSNLIGIPIENNYGSGTANSHWDEGDSPQTTSEKRYLSSIYHPALKLELMTGFLNKDDYFTGLTAGALKDYGYSANMNSPYVVGYPFNLIPTIGANVEFESKYHSCVSKGNGKYLILESNQESDVCRSTLVVKSDCCSKKGAKPVELSTMGTSSCGCAPTCKCLGMCGSPSMCGCSKMDAVAQGSAMGTSSCGCAPTCKCLGMCGSPSMCGCSKMDANATHYAIHELQTQNSHQVYTNVY